MMLKVKPFPRLHLPLNKVQPLFSSSSSSSPPSIVSFPKPFLSLSPPLRSSTSPTFTTSPTSPTSMDPTTTNTTVEHVVLFKVRDATDPSKIDAMLSNLRSLSSLDVVTHLTAGPILRLRSAAASAFGFTHILHSRYSSKPDLAAYSAHPNHLSVVKDFILPIVDDITAVDWVADGQFPAPLPGSALRLTLAKPKEGVETASVVAAIDGIKKLGAVAAKAEQLSYGENFSPARAKGFTVGFISVFPSIEELDGLMEDGEMVEAQKEKVRPLLDSVVVLDYVMPLSSSSPSASL